MRYDVYCRVVDNFGDAAVCWRLARQLAGEHAHSVRLWLDRPDVLGVLRPDLEGQSSRQVLDGVEVRHWRPELDIEDPGDVVIEGFGCGLPEKLTQAMAQRSPQSLWIVLEYLSAESWVEQCHGLPSPPPCLPLRRHFFFPGFSRASGGLLREADLPSRRAAFDSIAGAREEFWRDLGFAPPDMRAHTVSLFGYENHNIDQLLGAWRDGGIDTVVAVPTSRLRGQLGHFFGQSLTADGTSMRRGRLEVRLIPFLAQADYDRLLWACDWNFVRGEDSFVRAQWAAQPFVWQIYPQENDAHSVKLEAFLTIYLEGLAPSAARAFAGFWRAWNGQGGSLQTHWNEMQSDMPALRAHAKHWAHHLAEMPDLATNLAYFCAKRLKLTV